MSIEQIEQVDTVEGNTKTSTAKKKQVIQSKEWCFTLNNYTIEQREQIISCLEPDDLYIIGKEIGDGTRHIPLGTPHLQGYIKFVKKKRPMGVFKKHKLLKRIHWERCKGTERQNIVYCAKDGDYVKHDDVFVPRVKRKLKLLKESEFYPFETEMCRVLNGEPDDRLIYWITDRGKCNTGKTTFCKYLIKKYGAIMLGGKSGDMKNGIIDYKKNNDDEDPDIILINLPKTFDTSYLSYTGIEECKDMCFYSGKYEGGQVCGACPFMMIFSNEMPDFTKCDKNRWRVYDITMNDYITCGDVIQELKFDDGFD